MKVQRTKFILGQLEAGKTYEEIGHSLGVTRQRVQQILVETPKNAKAAFNIRINRLNLQMARVVAKDIDKLHDAAICYRCGKDNELSTGRPSRCRGCRISDNQAGARRQALRIRQAKEAA